MVYYRSMDNERSERTIGEIRSGVRKTGDAMETDILDRTRRGALLLAAAEIVSGSANTSKADLAMGSYLKEKAKEILPEQTVKLLDEIDSRRA